MDELQLHDSQNMDAAMPDLLAPRTTLPRECAATRLLSM